VCLVCKARHVRRVRLFRGRGLSRESIVDRRSTQTCAATHSTAHNNDDKFFTKALVTKHNVTQIQRPGWNPKYGERQGGAAAANAAPTKPPPPPLPPFVPQSTRYASAVRYRPSGYPGCKGWSGAAPAARSSVICRFGFGLAARKVWGVACVRAREREALAKFSCGGLHTAEIKAQSSKQCDKIQKTAHLPVCVARCLLDKPGQRARLLRHGAAAAARDEDAARLDQC
jgi:hypothetical protein